MSQRFDALRFRDFRLFWGAELGSRVGFWLQMVGQSWLVRHLSHSALTVGLVAAAQLIPSLLLAPVGGLHADRLPRRRLLLVTQVVLMLPPLALWRLANPTWSSSRPLPRSAEWWAPSTRRRAWL